MMLRTTAKSLIAIASALIPILLAAASIRPTSVEAQVPSVIPPITPDQMREDFIFLRDVWAPQDHSFSADQRKRFDAIVASALDNASQMTVADFALEISRAVAVARNGHTASSLGPYFHGLPLRMHWFSDGLYIVQAHPQFGWLVGARVERFGGLTTEEALARVEPYISGTDTRIRDLSGEYLRLLETLYRIQASTDTSSATLTLRFPDEAIRDVVLGPEPSAEPDAALIRGQPWRSLIPTERMVPGRWIHALDSIDPVPVAFRRPNDLSWEWMGERNEVLYLRSNRIVGNDGNRYGLFAKLIELLQSEVAPRQLSRIVVDLRLNGGGDLFNTILFAQALPKLISPRGRIFVLVGPSTFSAALVTAAMLKQYGGHRVMLVGEPMGDRNPFWSEGLPVRLPNSKIEIRPAVWMENWQDGCNDRSRCYWANTVFGDKPISLQPELRVPLTFADYAAGRDQVLDAALHAPD